MPDSTLHTLNIYGLQNISLYKLFMGENQDIILIHSLKLYFSNSPCLLGSRFIFAENNLIVNIVKVVFLACVILTLFAQITFIYYMSVEIVD